MGDFGGFVRAPHTDPGFWGRCLWLAWGTLPRVSGLVCTHPPTRCTKRVAPYQTPGGNWPWHHPPPLSREGHTGS